MRGGVRVMTSVLMGRYEGARVGDGIVLTTGLRGGSLASAGGRVVVTDSSTSFCPGDF